MFRFDCTFSNFNCTKRVQLHTILRPDGSPGSVLRFGQHASLASVHHRSGQIGTI